MYVKVCKDGKPRALHLVPSLAHFSDEPRLPRCEHVVIDHLKNDAGQNCGVEVELRYKDPADNVIIRLPRDGDAIYFENDSGDTVEAIQWPPRIPQTRRARMARREERKCQRTDSGPASSTGLGES